jgi:hypothetical protein
MPVIELPDKQLAEFPDDMPMEQIKAAIQRKFPPQNNNTPQPDGVLQQAGNFAQKNINEPIERNIINPVNSIPGMANLGISGINALGGNIPKVPMANFAPHNLPADAGNAASFFVGPGIVKTLGKIPEFASTARSAMKIPLIAEAIKHSANFLSKSPATSRIAGNALLGGAYSPDHPVIGMGMGAGAGAIGEGLTKGISGIKNSLENNEFLKNIISKFAPSSHAKELENSLSHGSNNITENSRLLANDIRNSHDIRNDEANIYLNHALDQAGDKKIYEKIDPLISTALDKSKNMIDKIKDLNVGDLYGAFKANPTFKNAHRLQSELGTMIGDLKKKPYRTPDETNQLGLIKSARDRLKDDISGFLTKHDEVSNMPIGDKYKKGIELYRENVAPFLSGQKLREIVRGRKTDVKNIHSIFDTPTNIVDKEGIEKIGPINKILQDLPVTSKNRILFNAIGGNKKNPNELLESLLKAKSKGYGNYFNPEVDQEINALNQKIKNTEMAKTGAKITGIGTIAGITGNALTHLF